MPSLELLFCTDHLLQEALLVSMPAGAGAPLGCVPTIAARTSMSLTARVPPTRLDFEGGSALGRGGWGAVICVAQHHILRLERRLVHSKCSINVGYMGRRIHVVFYPS